MQFYKDTTEEHTNMLGAYLKRLKITFPNLSSHHQCMNGSISTASYAKLGIIFLNPSQSHYEKISL